MCITSLFVVVVRTDLHPVIYYFTTATKNNYILRRWSSSDCFDLRRLSNAGQYKRSDRSSNYVDTYKSLHVYTYTWKIFVSEIMSKKKKKKIIRFINLWNITLDFSRKSLYWYKRTMLYWSNDLLNKQRCYMED